MRKQKKNNNNHLFTASEVHGSFLIVLVTELLLLSLFATSTGHDALSESLVAHLLGFYSLCLHRVGGL